VLAFITQRQNGAGAITPLQSQLPPWACQLRASEIFAGHTPPLFLLHNSKADYVFLLLRKSVVAAVHAHRADLTVVCAF
jgi:hypothetical protein